LGGHGGGIQICVKCCGPGFILKSSSGRGAAFVLKINTPLDDNKLKERAEFCYILSPEPGTVGGRRQSSNFLSDFGVSVLWLPIALFSVYLTVFLSVYGTLIPYIACIGQFCGASAS